MNDDQLLRANAYLDDDLAATERARAEDDAEVMAEVARLRDVRDALRAVDAPAGDRRDRAIAAALAAFDEQFGTARTVTPVPRPRRSRRAWYPLGAVAAGLIAIAATGIVVSRGGGSNDDDTAAVATAARSSETINAALAAGAADATGPSDTAANGPASAGESDAAAAAPAMDSGPRLRSPADLAAYAASLPPALPDTESATAADDATCAAGDLVGPATYVVDGVDVAVEVFVDGDQAVAVDRTSCVEIARVDMP